MAFHPEIPSDGVELRLAYPQEHLRFAANGEPPYMLVAGTLSEEADPYATFAAFMDAPSTRIGFHHAEQQSARLSNCGESAYHAPRIWKIRLPLDAELPVWVAISTGERNT